MLMQGESGMMQKREGEASHWWTAGSFLIQANRRGESKTERQARHAGAKHCSFTFLVGEDGKEVPTAGHHMTS